MGFRSAYGTYLFDILFTAGNITFNGRKEVGDVTPVKDVAVPGLAIAGLKTVRLEAMMSSGGTAWIDDVQILALTGSELPTRFGNISTRLNVGLDTNVLIGGFIVTGSAPKRVLLRAIGPSLPLGGVLADPVLELHDSKGATIATNDNWTDSPDKQEIIDTTIAPNADKESAIVESLSPGVYTAIVTGKDEGTGVGLVEVYDLDQTDTATLANVSTRGEVLLGDNVMIGGLIITGPSATNVLFRAIGPSLSITGALADPALEFTIGMERLSRQMITGAAIRKLTSSRLPFRPLATRSRRSMRHLFPAHILRSLEEVVARPGSLWSKRTNCSRIGDSYGGARLPRKMVL